MVINCARCNKKIIEASSKNAKYIRNESDVRTFVDSKRDEFEVFDDGVFVGKFDKFTSAREEKRKRDKPYEDSISAKRLQMKSSHDEFKRLKDLPDTPDRSNKMNIQAVEIQSITNDIEIERQRINKIVITHKEVIKPLPKLVIICRDPNCQDPNDFIIWG